MERRSGLRVQLATYNAGQMFDGSGVPDLQEWLVPTVSESRRSGYATTDADSVVDADWLVRMVAAGADMVLGVVRVPTWRNFSPAVMRRYMRDYWSPGPGHRHVHGANMGFRADLYWGVGGFRALPTGEDVELVERFERARLSIHRDRYLSVATSDRRDARAPGGFAQHLRKLSRSPRTNDAKAS